MSDVMPEDYDEKLEFLQDRIAQIPEDQRWRFHIEHTPRYDFTCGSAGGEPYIADITAPKVTHKTHVTRYGSGGSGLGALGAGVVGYAIGSMLDD